MSIECRYCRYCRSPIVNTPCPQNSIDNIDNIDNIDISGSLRHIILASIRTFSRVRYTAMAKSDPPIPLYAMRSVMPLLLIPDRISTYREFIWAHLLRRPVTGLASESFAGSARVVEASMLTRVHLLMAFSLRSARTAMVANIVAAFIFQHALRCSDHRLG